jgi:hypothetical protein
LKIFFPPPRPEGLATGQGSALWCVEILPGCGRARKTRPVGSNSRISCAHPEVIMPTADSAASKVTAALLVIGSKTPVRPHQRHEHRLYRGISDGARHRISRKCGWLATRRQRSSTHSIRCGVATPISSAPAVSGRRTATLPPTCVAKAFGVPVDRDPRALAILHE